MHVDERLEQIVHIVTEQGFASVKELSRAFAVSEVTIRRDLQQLQKTHRIRRIHGGATPMPVDEDSRPVATRSLPSKFGPVGYVVFDRVDVLIATSVDPYADRVLLDRMEQRQIPVVTESIGMRGMKTLVAVDNYAASRDLGAWAGRYAQQHFDGQAMVLDLTYQLQNTQERSRGFMDGLRDILPAAQTALSINVQSAAETARQLTKDALMVHPSINVIFAINDASAFGAVQACRDMGLDLDDLLILPFGLEGDTMKDVLAAGEFCKAGVAMFPEIVGPVCVEAAIRAYLEEPLPGQLVTPYAVLTTETLLEYYNLGKSGWQINWDMVSKHLQVPLPIKSSAAETALVYPARIGFVVPFMEHEWYKNLILSMEQHVTNLPIELEVVDVDQNLKDEVAVRRKAIAEKAAELVRPHEVLLLGGGQISIMLAEELATKGQVTVITNSIPVFDILRSQPNVTLVSTGGMLRYPDQTLVGPLSEGTLRELRADKLFLEVAGVTMDFGLSDSNLAEVTMMQGMIRAARQVVLLADHTKFGQESVVQLAPTTAVDVVITDNALPASARIDLTKLGIEVIVAKI